MEKAIELKQMNENEFTKEFINEARGYLLRLSGCFKDSHLEQVKRLGEDLLQAWMKGQQVFICGNGGSAANALHMANDFHYGIGASKSEPTLPGLKVEALSANSAVITCLANDTGYENIYSNQLNVKGNSSDLLIALSGSGNSKNIINALYTAKKMKIKSYAILAFSGGKCKEIADEVIHFPVNDMQVAEDTQLIIGHICMQWLNANKPNKFD